MADSRLRSVYLAASRLFNTRRYANTKVAQIAAAAGIATGTIYNLFESKRAILAFVIRASLDERYLDGEIALPIAQADMGFLLDLFDRACDRAYNDIMIVSDGDGRITRGFVRMLSDAFELTADYLPAFNIIEHNSEILRELADRFFPLRHRVLDMIGENLKLYMEAGEVRPLDYPKVHAQSIVDILTWWGNNAYIAMPDTPIPRQEAKKIAIDLLARAYLKE